MKTLFLIAILAICADCVKKDQYDLVYLVPGYDEQFSVNTIPLSKEDCEVALIEMTRTSSDFNYKCVASE